MRVAILAFPRCQMLDVIGPLEVFAEVNREVGKDTYQVEIVSSAPGPLIGCSGIGLVPSRTIADRTVAVDTLLVAGGPDISLDPATIGNPASGDDGRLHSIHDLRDQRKGSHQGVFHRL